MHSQPTEAQLEVLRAIAAATQPPFPPTLTEIAKAGGWRSPSGVLFHLDALQAAGLVERRKGRGGVLLTALGQRTVRRSTR